MPKSLFNQTSENFTFEQLFNAYEDHSGLSALVKALPDLVFILNEDGRYVDILSDDETLLYKQAEQLKGQLMIDVLPPPVADDAMEAVRDTLQTGDSNIVEYELDVPAGKLWFEGLTAPFQKKDADGKKLVLWVARDITARKQAEFQREEVIGQLKEALDQVKKLNRLLPICSACKKIRDDDGYWSQVEDYISQNSEIEFTHGICPDCMNKLYPGFHIPDSDE
jgi:PAS domain S-box-containing protein